MKRWIAVVTMVLAFSPGAWAQTVHFDDPKLKDAVKQQLGITRDPTYADMLGLEWLVAEDKGISDLTGLEYATNLSELILCQNQINDISALGGLTNLKWLKVQDNQISDISPLGGLTRMGVLNLSGNQISDISPLAGLKDTLKQLELRDNQISDISPLAGFTNLCSLWGDCDDFGPSLGLVNNPLDAEACSLYIPLIESNNPDSQIMHDPCPPMVLTQSATQGRCGFATLRGLLVNDNGEASQVRFGLQRPPFPGFPPRWPLPTYTAWQTKSRGEQFQVEIHVDPGKEYSFWAEAENSAGTSQGETLSFTTPDGVAVPALANMTKSQAQAALQAVGLVLGTVSGDAAGKVASQSPKSGSQACAGSAVAITLTLREAKVPDVVGMSESEATAALEAAGFLADLSYGPSDEDPGTVFKQDPVGRTVVLEGTEVRLTISQDDDGGPGPGPVPALPTPVAHWKLDESTGTIAHDAAGSHPGALKGNPAWQPSGGKIDGALRFDGVDDYVDTSYTEDLAAWTVSVWVRSPVAPSAGTTTGPVHREQNYQLNWDHGNQAFRGAAGLNVGGTWHAASFGPLTANTWYHLGATYDGQALRSYKNGVAVTTNDAPSGNPRPETASLKLGRHALSPTYFGGTIDDVRIYDEVLNENQIRAVMAGSEAWIPTEGNDIGTPVTGSDSYTGGVYTVVADGADVWAYRDEFRYVYTAVAGDFEFSARVLNLENTNWWAKAGVMVRETLDPESRHAFMCVTPEDGEGRFAFQCRPETPGLSTSIHSIQGQVAYPTNTWVKIKRQGNAFTALTSQDGTTWTKFTGHEVDLQGYPDAPNPVTIAMPQIVYIGLAVTSHSNGQLCTAEFDNVQLDNPAVTP